MSELERVPSAPEVVDLGQVLDILSERAGASTEVVQTQSRVAKRAQWASQLRWTEDNRHSLREAAGRIGTLALPELPRDLEAQERDALMEEALLIRDMQDRVQGRYDAIRGTVFSILDLQSPDQEGALLAPGIGKKFVREVRGKPSIDWDKVLATAPPKVRMKIALVRRVTTTVTTLAGDPVSHGETNETFVDEAAALEAIKSGELSLDLLADAIIPAKKTSYFTIRDLTPEDSMVV